MSDLRGEQGWEVGDGARKAPLVDGAAVLAAGGRRSTAPRGRGGRRGGGRRRAGKGLRDWFGGEAEEVGSCLGNGGARSVFRRISGGRGLRYGKARGWRVFMRSMYGDERRGRDRASQADIRGDTGLEAPRIRNELAATQSGTRGESNDPGQRGDRRPREQSQSANQSLEGPSINARAPGGDKDHCGRGRHHLLARCMTAPLLFHLLIYSSSGTRTRTGRADDQRRRQNSGAAGIAARPSSPGCRCCVRPSSPGVRRQDLGDAAGDAAPEPRSWRQ